MRDFYLLPIESSMLTQQIIVTFKYNTQAIKDVLQWVQISHAKILFKQNWIIIIIIILIALIVYMENLISLLLIYFFLCKHYLWTIYIFFSLFIAVICNLLRNLKSVKWRNFILFRIFLSSKKNQVNIIIKNSLFKNLKVKKKWKKNNRTCIPEIVYMRNKLLSFDELK